MTSDSTLVYRFVLLRIHEFDKMLWYRFVTFQKSFHISYRQIYQHRYQIRFIHLNKPRYSNAVKARSKVQLKPALYTILGITAICPVIYYQTLSAPQKREVNVAVSSIARFLRSLRIALTISADYWWNLYGLDEDSDEFNKIVKLCHQRSANRIVEGCLQNGGVYVKLGQGLVSFNHVLPKEYTSTLVVLQDKALARSKDEIQQLFLEDFGKMPKELFLDFEDEPIAAASLAQVYKATTHDGRKVAVKAQYIDLRDRFYQDCRTVEILVYLIGQIHPNFDFYWLMDYLKKSLSRELDFILEGENMERCRKELAHLPFVYIPEIHWDKSSKRILTLEYIDGVKISNFEGIKKLNLTLKDVDNKLVLTFAEQIFHTGFVHADPHPGNVFIRKGNNGKAELVLLDHGLYEYFPERNRISLCNLWKSIMLNNNNGMKKYSSELGVDDYYLFCEILMQRPLKRSQLKIKNQLRQADIDYMVKMAKNHFDRIMSSIRSLPFPMLLIFRNINTVRSITKEHGNPVDRYTIMARRAVRGAFEKRSSNLLHRFLGLMELLKFDLKLRWNAFCFYVSKTRLRFLAYLGSVDASEIFKLMEE